MQQTRKTPFLANIYVCDRRSILKDITIISTKLSPEDTKRKALAKMESFRKVGQYAALQKLHGLYDDGKTYSSHSAAIKKGTARHEGFHGMVQAAGLDKKSGYPPLEESAAYAYESVAPRQEVGASAADQTRCQFARDSVRFLFALDRTGHEEMLLDSMVRLCDSTPEAIAGDWMAIALLSAFDLAFYLECIAVLRHWGVRKGKKVLLEAVGVSDVEGADAGRRFLLGRLTAKTRDSISASYGVDLDGFRFRSLRSPRVECDTWEW